jgi:hypothetical protein
LSLVLRDRTGLALRGAEVNVEAFANARAGRVLHADFKEIGAGNYRAELPFGRAGLWVFRISARAGTERATAIVRKDVVVR